MMYDSVVMYIILNGAMQAFVQGQRRLVPSAWHAEKECDRWCGATFGVQRLRRQCNACDGRTNECTVVDWRQCEAEMIKTVRCYKGHHCHGSGIYTGEWSTWKSAETCPPPGPEGCGRSVIEYRICEKSSKTLGDVFLCSDVEGSTESKTIDCQCLPNVQSWGAWSPWKCNQECTDATVTAKRTRRCYGLADNPCHPDPRTRLENIEQNSCIAEDGNLRCLKTWTEWSAWNACPTQCGYFQHNRTRNCIGFGKECDGESFESNPCQPASICPKVHGLWGPWSQYSDACSVSCGTGYRTRFRRCNRPPPMGGGDICDGLDTSRIMCDTRIYCPLNGEWSSWSQWSCDATCNGTTEIRFRMCDRPRPMFRGAYCVGNETELRVAGEKSTCAVSCEEPPLLLPPLLASKLGDYLSTLRTSFEVTEKASVTMDCRSEISDELRVRYTKDNVVPPYRWLFNGDELLTKDGQTVNIGGLVLESVTKEDTGVYVCQIILHGDAKQSVYVASVSVATAEPTETVSVGEPYYLYCNTALLALLFPSDTQLSTYFNGLIVKIYEEQDTASLNVIHFETITSGHEGIWKCIVMRRSTQQTWTTGWVRLATMSGTTSLLEFLSDPRFLVFLASGVVLVVGGLFGYAMHVIRSVRKAKDKKLKETAAEVKEARPEDVNKKSGSFQ